jgi:RNA-binding motif X-linked protein 2
MNTIREVEQINQQELERGIAGTPASWHSQYRNSPWVYVGNLDHQLTEGDVLCVMSQFGEIEDINLQRDDDTGKSRGFAFVKYEDARSCILAVDNFVGIKLCGRSLRVDHMEKYRLPKKILEQEEAKEGKTKFGAGHAYKDAELANQYSVHQGQDLFAAPQEPDDPDKKRRKEEKKQRKEEKLERKRKREEKRIQKEEERRKRRADRFHKDHSMDGDNSKEERRKDRKRKHRKEDRYHDSEEEESRRRRKSHKRRHRDRDDSSSSRHDRKRERSRD